MVAHPTESARPESGVALRAYLDEVLTPALAGLGCSVRTYENPDPRGGPFLVGRRVESPGLPTLLCYGHADVVEGQAGRWSEGRDPWTLTADGERWYGRGAADNKGQHLVGLAALRLLLAERRRLGFKGGVLVVSTALNFILQYLPTFGINELGPDDSLSYVALFVTGAILTSGTPVVGLLADRYGRVRIMLPAAVLIGAAAVPLFHWLTASPSFLTPTLCMTVLGLLKAAYFGALPSVMADVFPARARATGLSFSYHTTVAVFGGFTPTIAAALVTATGSQVSPAYYLLAVAVLSVSALLAGARSHGIR